MRNQMLLKIGSFALLLSVSFSIAGCGSSGTTVEMPKNVVQPPPEGPKALGDSGSGGEAPVSAS